MNILSSVGICFVPLLSVTVILLIAVKKLKVRYVFLSYLLGLAAIIPITIIQQFIYKLPIFTEYSLVSYLIFAFIFNGLIEETFKMIVLFLLPHKKLEFSSFSSCAYLSGFSLGTFEAVIYLIGGSENLSIRLMITPFLHAALSTLSGYYVWSYRKNSAKIAPFLTAIVIHGLFNFFARFKTGLWWFSVITLIYAYIRVKFSYKSLTSSQNDVNILNDFDAG